MDAHLQQVAELLRHYIPLLKDQIALIDKAESDGKFGEGISDPTTIQMLWNLQRQALGPVTMILGMSNSAWSDGAGRYLRLENAKNQRCP
jgi:hypothetical protein